MASKKNTQTDIDNDLAPTSNPDAGKRVSVHDGVAATGSERELPEPKTKVAGADLVPNIEAASARTGVSRVYKYWVGVTPSCPANSITIAGINFPKVNEQLIPDPARTGRKKRRMVAGAIVFMTEDKVRRLKERLPRTVIRFNDEAAVQHEPGTGENIGDVAQRPKKGHLITIPTDAELEERRRRGKVARRYIPDPRRDVPAARFMFAQLCADQDRPEQGEFFPDPLEITGLDWPDELEAVDKLLS